MATRDTDLTSLRIDRSARSGGVPNRFRRLRRWLGWVLIVALVAGAFFFFKDYFRPGLEVQLAPVSFTSPAQASAVLTASGYVVARRKAAVASKGTGTLVYLGVDEGDRVKRGQVIARLEDSDVLATLARAKENLRVEEADLKDARLSLERLNKLLKDGFVAQAEYDTAEARYQRVVASIAAAQFAVKEAEVAVENTRIVAPFDGTVLKKNADVGEIVAPLAGAASSRAAVVTIADMNSLEVEADVSEANITRVTSGQNCEIRLDAYPDRAYGGAVSKIVPTADRAKATVLVKINFKSYDHRVLPEMSAKIAFLAKGFGADPAAFQPVLTVPAAAVVERSGRPVVFQMKSGLAVEVPVTTGRRIGALIEIKEGLKDGDKVIAKSDENLRAGAKVAVKIQ